jgi:C1A family cysteine protease
VRNSWGKKFGLQGYFTMPYEYMLKDHLSADFWTVNVVS